MAALDQMMDLETTLFWSPAVVFPTLWEYLLRLGVPESDVYYLGASIASLTVTDMVASLFVGRLLDRFSRVSLFFLLLNLCQVRTHLFFFFFRDWLETTLPHCPDRVQHPVPRRLLPCLDHRQQTCRR